MSVSPPAPNCQDMILSRKSPMKRETSTLNAMMRAAAPIFCRDVSAILIPEAPRLGKRTESSRSPAEDHIFPAERSPRIRQFCIGQAEERAASRLQSMKMQPLHIHIVSHRPVIHVGPFRRRGNAQKAKYRHQRHGRVSRRNAAPPTPDRRTRPAQRARSRKGRETRAGARLRA